MNYSYKNLAHLYSKVEYSGTGFLAYRDIPSIINNYTLSIDKDTACLDFGCGTGDSTRLLQSIGLNPIGVDINSIMLNEASKLSRYINYILIDQHNLPFPEKKFDVILLSLVLMEIESYEKIVQTLTSLNAILKDSGILIVTTTTKELYQIHDWITIDTNFIENSKLVSGGRVKVNLTDINLNIIDYFWDDQDYKQSFIESNFNIIQDLKPLGKKTDPFLWRSELFYPPFSLYVLEKSTT